MIWKMKRLRPSEVDAWLNRTARVAGLGFEPGALGFSGHFPLHISSCHACREEVLIASMTTKAALPFKV